MKSFEDTIISAVKTNKNEMIAIIQEYIQEFKNMRLLANDIDNYIQMSLQADLKVCTDFPNMPEKFINGMFITMFDKIILTKAYYLFRNTTDINITLVLERLKQNNVKFAKELQEAIKYDTYFNNEYFEIIKKIEEKVKSTIVTKQDVSEDEEIDSTIDKLKDLQNGIPVSTLCGCQGDNTVLPEKTIIVDSGESVTFKPSYVDFGIHIIQEDITNLDADVLVTSSNRNLIAGSFGVNKAVFEKAGKELDDACRIIGLCNPGEVKVTRGFKTNAKFIFHVVVPRWSDTLTENENISNTTACYKKCFDKALEIGAKSIIFPILGGGARSIPIKTACEIAYNACRPYKDVLDIVLVAWTLAQMEHSAEFLVKLNQLNGDASANSNPV